MEKEIIIPSAPKRGLDTFSCFGEPEPMGRAAILVKSLKLSGVLPKEEVLKNIEDKLNALKYITWNGIISSSAMKEAGNRNWQQIEWIDWYLEHWATENMSNVFSIHSHKDKTIVFDAFETHDWDFKTHSNFDSKGRKITGAILNDKRSIDKSLEKYGQIGFVVLDGDPIFGDNFETWRKETSGGESTVSIKNREKGRTSRKRKDSFKLTSAKLYIITKEDAKNLFKNKGLTLFRQGKQNDGTPRHLKYVLDMSRVAPSYVIELCSTEEFSH